MNRSRHNSIFKSFKNLSTSSSFPFHRRSQRLWSTRNQQRRFARSEFATSSVVQSHHKHIAYWLGGCAGLVGGMVVVGGLTRLTVSGLSMVDWRPQGSLPPMSLSYPQYKRSERDMTLSEFKTIFYWEWGHRMLGRVTGLAFAGPLVYFAVKKRIPKWLWPRLMVMLGLGGAQGLIGWWMVRSGLDEQLLDPHKVARVSPYRLSTHLTMAFTLYSMLTWSVMDLLRPLPSLNLAVSVKSGPIRHLNRLSMMAFGTGGLVLCTVIAGAFVAGNDAGRAYNTFPDMNGEYFPSEAWDMEPWWRNIFENTALVQFNHRTLGLSTAAWISGMLAYARSPAIWPMLTKSSRLAIGAVTGVAAVQVSLGITAILYYVPVEIGSLHQTGALVLWTSSLFLAHSLRGASKAANVLRRRMI